MCLLSNIFPVVYINRRIEGKKILGTNRWPIKSHQHESRPREIFQCNTQITLLSWMRHPTIDNFMLNKISIIGNSPPRTFLRLQHAQSSLKICLDFLKRTLFWVEKAVTQVHFISLGLFLTRFLYRGPQVLKHGKAKLVTW